MWFGIILAKSWNLKWFFIFEWAPCRFCMPSWLFGVFFLEIDCINLKNLKAEQATTIHSSISVLVLFDGSSNLFVSSDVWSCRGILVKLVLHQISVDEIENPCYWINRCRFDMVLPSILSTQYWASLIFSPSIVIGKIDHFCVPRGQWRFFIKIKAKASICSWEVCFCCCTH